MGRRKKTTRVRGRKVDRRLHLKVRSPIGVHYIIGA